MATTVTPLFTWKEEYSIHHPEVDAQHKRLVTLLNSLHAGMMEGSNSQRLRSLLSELVRYTVVHFASEEKLMAASNYPGYKMHCQVHQDFTRQVADFQNKFEAGRVTLSIELLQFLKTWLRDHIQGSDLEFGRYLLAREKR